MLLALCLKCSAIMMSAVRKVYFRAQLALSDPNKSLICVPLKAGALERSSLSNINIINCQTN